MLARNKVIPASKIRTIPWSGTIQPAPQSPGLLFPVGIFWLIFSPSISVISVKGFFIHQKPFTMQTHNLGYPRIGSNRELKKANEQFWQGKITQQQLSYAGKEIRKSNWRLQQAAGIDWIPSNDFSFYDQVLDMTLTVEAIPERYHDILLAETRSDLNLYFSIARRYQDGTIHAPAIEMNTWLDTNYQYILPEFRP